MNFLKIIFNDSLIRNSFFLMASNLLNLVMGFFFWIIAAKYYTPNEVGTISALLSSTLLISMISTLGFPTAFLFYLPREPKNANRIINSCLTSSIATSLIFSFIFVAGIDLWAPPIKFILNDFDIFMLFAAVTAFLTTSGLISSAFIAARRSSFHLYKEMIFGFIKILPLPMFSVFGAIGIFLAFGIGLMFALVISFFLLSHVWKRYWPTPMLDPIIKSMAGYSAWNYLAEMFFSLPRLLLPIMIVNLVSTESTGFFFIASMIAGILYGIPQSISNSLFAESSNPQKLWQNLKKSIKFNVALLFPGVLMFILFGKFVLNLFNPSYAENASTTLTILVIASLPLSVNILFTSVKNVQKKVHSVVITNASIAAITLVFAFPLVKSSGIEGAAVAYLMANTVVAIFVVYNMKNRLLNLSYDAS